MRKPQFVPSLILLISLPVLLWLGTWQLERLAWKEALIARVEARVKQPPIPLPPSETWATMRRAADEYRRVTLRGEFDHSKEQYWHTTPVAGQKGVQVITPLTLSDGTTVLVNRGFISDAFKNPQARAFGQVGGQVGGQMGSQVTISGLLHWHGVRTWFDPPDEPQNNFWFVRDVQSMAQNMGVTAAPFFVDADAAQNSAKNAPIGGQTRLHFSNRHLEYALTWYSFALILVIIFVLWHIFPATKMREEGRL